MKKATRITGIEASAEARKLSCAILEVMGGLRGPTEAAAALGVSLPRYYILEARALEGFMKALEPREKGKREASAETRLAEMSRERDRLMAELNRSRALARMAQKAAGLSPAGGGKGEGKEDGKPRKGKRRADRTRRLLLRLRPGGTVAEPVPSPAGGADPAVEPSP